MDGSLPAIGAYGTTGRRGALAATNRWIDPLEVLYQQEGLAPAIESVRLDAPWNMFCLSPHETAKSAWEAVCRAADMQPVDLGGLRDISILERLLNVGEFESEPEAVIIGRPELINGNWRIHPEPVAVEVRGRQLEIAGEASD